jgi:DNA-binding transcriptional regulator GbsR (MarR family)
MLREALMEQPAVADDIHAQARMKEMHELIELMTGWMDEVQKMDSASLASLMKMGAKVQKLLEVTDKVKATFSRATPASAASAASAAKKPAPGSKT